MSSDDFHTRASALVQALTTALPRLQFHAYSPLERTEGSALYIVGFMPPARLLGVYAIEAERLPWDFTLHVLNLAQFFAHAWQLEEIRFHPPALRTVYEAQTTNSGKWYRVV